MASSSTFLMRGNNMFVLLPQHHECVSYLIAMANSTNFDPEMKCLLLENPVMITTQLYINTKKAMIQQSAIKQN